jgi:uracil-DNA glycosylase
MERLGNYVPGDGPTPCPVMIVGEAPGADEDRFFKPFIGKSGRLLNDTLDAAGLSRESVYVTNIVKRRPPDNRTPTREEILDNLEFLVKEIAVVRPRFVLLLGNTALSALTNFKSGIMNARGAVPPYCTVFPRFVEVWATVHPSAALRSKANKNLFETDIQEFAKRVRALVPELREERSGIEE